MALMEDTPSRIWRRIEEEEGQEVPSLPSIPLVQASQGEVDATALSDEQEHSITSFSSQPEGFETRVTSTPLATIGANPNSASRRSDRTVASMKFANSLHTSRLPGRGRRDGSFEISPIRSSNSALLEESVVVDESEARAAEGNGDLDDAEASREMMSGGPEPPEDEQDEDEQLNEAQESFVSYGGKESHENYEEYQVSLRSEPKPSPKDPMKNISVRRRASQHAPPAPAPPLSHSSPSGSSSSSPSTTNEQTPMRNGGPAVLSASLSPPSDLSARSTPRDASHLSRAFANSPLQTPLAAKPNQSTTPSSFPPLPPSAGSFDSEGSVRLPQTPYHDPSARRRSYALSLLSTAPRPRPRSTPHPHPTARRPSHPLIRTPLDRASVVSGGSSTPSTNNDLTTLPRANASFDPATGEARFNAAKMNGYLHVLNGALVEENLGLIERVRELEESTGNGSGSGPGTANGTASLAIEDHLEQVVTDLREELEREQIERGRLSEELKALKIDLARKDKDRDGATRQLRAEIEDAKREASEWRSKAEASKLAHDQDIAKRDKEDAKLDKGLQSFCFEMEQKLERGNREIAELKEKLKDATGNNTEAERVKVLQDRLDVERAQRDVERKDMREQARALEMRVSEMQHASAAHDSRGEQLALTTASLSAAQQELQHVKAQLRQAQASLTEERTNLGFKQAEIDQANAGLHDLSEELSAMQDKVDALDAERRELLADLTDAVTERDELRIALTTAENQGTAEEGRSIRPENRDPVISDLEEQLDNAHRELGALRHQLLATPSDAIVRAQQARIESLIAEMDQLKERLQKQEAPEPLQTPGRRVTFDEASVSHKALLAVRALYTPGGPLKDISGLDSSTQANETTLLRAENARLALQVRAAEQDGDAKIDELEEKTNNIRNLTDKLGKARARVSELSCEVSRLAGRDAVLEKRLATLKCLSCKKRFDATNVMACEDGDADRSISMIEESLEVVPRGTTEDHRAVVADLNDRLSSLMAEWEVERRHWHDEKMVLEGANSRVTAERATEARKVQQDMRDAMERERKQVLAETMQIKDDGERKQAVLQKELHVARSMIKELHSELDGERKRLQSLADEQSKVSRERDAIRRDLERNQKELSEIKASLQSAKRSNTQLEAELEESAGLGQKAQRLEGKLGENVETINALRQERSSILAKQAELQLQLTKAVDDVDRIRQEHAGCRTAYEKRCRQLEEQAGEISEMRRTASRQTDDLRDAERDRDRLHADRLEVRRTISSLEDDLHQVRRDGERLGRDLLAMRSEKDILEVKLADEKALSDRYKAQAQTQIRLLNEQMDEAREKARQLEDKISQHVCEADLSHMRLQHNQECKGLMVQIRYLKDKFTRESAFRSDLSYQKRYLLDVLSCLEKNEQRILAAIARVGYPSPTKRRTSAKLRSAVWCVIFLNRTRLASSKWQSQRASRPAITAALEDVRRKRAL